VPENGRSKWFHPSSCQTRSWYPLPRRVKYAPPPSGIAQQLILDRRVVRMSCPRLVYLGSGNRKEDRASVFECPPPCESLSAPDCRAGFDSFKAYALSTTCMSRSSPSAFRPALLHKPDVQHPAWPSLVPGRWRADCIMQSACFAGRREEPMAHWRNNPSPRPRQSLPGPEGAIDAR